VDLLSVAGGGSCGGGRRRRRGNNLSLRLPPLTLLLENRTLKNLSQEVFGQ